MKKIIVLSLLAWGCFVGSVAAHPVQSQDTLRFTPTAETVQDVLQRMLAAIGSDSLAHITDRTLTGHFYETANGHDAVGELLTIEAAPAKRSDELLFIDKNIKHVINGTHSWMTDSTGKLYPLSGPALKSDIAQALFNPELHLRDNGVVVALLGTAMDSTEKCYVLKVQFKDSYPELWYVASSSWQIVKRAQPVQGKLQWYHFSDFRKIDGVTYPFRITATGPQNFSIVYDQIRHNVHPSASTFEGS